MTNMTNENKSSLKRPGFIVAAVVVALILVLAIALVVTNATRDDSNPTVSTANVSSSGGSSESEQKPSETAPISETDRSVCGLEGVRLEKARLANAPAVDDWDYQGTAAYPYSKEYGPGATAKEGYKYCFQHSPTGAVYAAAYITIVSADRKIVYDYLDYILAQGPYRDEMLEPISGRKGASKEKIRMKILGYQLLEYDGSSASVDVAFTLTAGGDTTTMSGVYPLVWADGDWKLSTEDPPNSGDVVPITDTSAYVLWGP